MNQKKTTNMEVKRKNRNGVFRYICRRGTVSNPDISYELKISLPTVTQITKELIEKGLVEEKGELESTGGRRAKALSAAVNAKLAVGLDITKNHISLALVNIGGEMLRFERIYLPYDSEEAYYRKVADKMEAFLEGSGMDRKRILGMGISFPGIVNLEREMITYSHILGLRAIPFEAVSRFFPYPCFFVNDANAGAYAEGFGREHSERFFYLSLSNTVGGALFSRNELVQGKNFRCGEAGHMTVVADGEACYCGKRGCLDVYCSASRLSDIAEGKLEQFFAALERGEKKAVKRWEKYTDYLAVAVNNIHMILDCDVILGGYVGSYVSPYMQGIWDKVSGRNTFEEKEAYVKACSHRTGAAALGAGMLVIEDFVSQV